MTVRYFFENEKISDQEKDYIEKKAEKILKFVPEFSGQEDEVKVEIDVKQDRRGFWCFEVMLQTPYKLYRVDKTKPSLLEAVDSAEEAMKAQVNRDMEKISDLRKKGAREAKEELVGGN